MIKEDGTVVNIADLLAGEADAVSESAYNINFYSAQSGRMIREDKIRRCMMYACIEL